MLYQLPNGKVIEISTEQFVEMTDEELEYLIAFNYGDALEDPWFGSVLLKGSPPADIEDEITLELPDVPQGEKYSDLDLDEDLISE